MELLIIRDALIPAVIVLIATITTYFCLRARYGALNREFLLMYILCSGIMTVGTFVFLAGLRLTTWFNYL